jgi:Rrf2 family protein
LVSQKGLGGGFALARPASRISLYDILEPFEDVQRLTGCFLGRAECSGHVPCHVHEAWAPVRDAYTGFLRGTTLEDLARAGGLYRLDRFLEAE